MVKGLSVGESILFPNEKKCGVEECVDFRTITLILHTSKILLKILTYHLKSKAEFRLEKD